MIFLIFLVHFFRTTHWGLTFPGDKPVPGVSSGIECPLNDMLRYALNDRAPYHDGKTVKKISSPKEKIHTR